MDYRELGRTGQSISIVGLGGIVVKGLPQHEADALVAEAIDRGVNYFDVAPSYGDPEDKLGGALAGKRNRVFLAGKTTQRTAAEAAKELETTLKRLKTDHLDVYQMHGLDDPAELETALGSGGAMETFEAARAAGKVKFIGITGHSMENLCKAIQTGRFDTVLFPVNFSQFEIAGYGPEVLALAKSMNVGRMAIKAAAKRPWGANEKWTYPNCWYEPLSDRDAFTLAIRYALSQDISSALSPGDPGLFRMALDVAEDFRPVEGTDLQRLRELSNTFSPLFAAKAG